MGAPAQVLSGVAIVGGQAQQRGRLTAAERAELGHVGQQVSSRETTAAGDRPDDGGAVGEDGAGGDAHLHALLAGGDTDLEGVECRGGAPSGLRIEFGAELAEGPELVEEIAAESEQVAELPEVLRPGRDRCEDAEKAEAGELRRLRVSRATPAEVSAESYYDDLGSSRMVPSARRFTIRVPWAPKVVPAVGASSPQERTTGAQRVRTDRAGQLSLPPDTSIAKRQ